jgi:hypothetical protein
MDLAMPWTSLSMLQATFYQDERFGGGYSMAIVRHRAGREVTPEKEAALRAQVRATAKRPYTYDQRDGSQASGY